VNNIKVPVLFKPQLMSFLIVDEFFDFNQHPSQGKIKFKDELNGHFWGNTVRQNN